MRNELSQSHCFNRTNRCVAGLVLLTAFSAIASGQGADIRATVNGDTVVFQDVQPVMINNRVMVPVRGVFEHMNSTVGWDERTQTVRANHGADRIRMQINSRDAYKNDQDIVLDSPAMMYRGRTLVPLRALSEMLGAHVNWISETQTVEINTGDSYHPARNTPDYSSMSVAAGTVIPFHLNQRLSSDGSRVGDRFEASLDTGDSNFYQGLPQGSVVEGHVDVAQPRTGRNAGVLGVAFDRVRLPDGRAYPVQGRLIDLESDSVQGSRVKYTARPQKNDDNLRYVGYGAAAGAIVSVATKGNLLTETVGGAALGFIVGALDKNHSPREPRDVAQEKGARFGVRLTETLRFRDRFQSPNSNRG